MKEFDLEELNKKYALTVNESSVLFGIGQQKIRKLSDIPNNSFTLKVGRKIMIKRDAFINYLEKRTNL